MTEHKQYIVVAEAKQQPDLVIYDNLEDASNEAKGLVGEHALGDRYIVVEVIRVHSLETEPQPKMEDKL